MDAQAVSTAQINRAHNVTWTDDQFGLLVRLYGEGKSAAICADLINRETGSNYTRSAVIGKWHRCGFEPRERNAIVPRRNPRKSYAKVIQLFQPKPADVLAEQSKHLLFSDLEAKSCRFAYGTEFYTFCGHDKMEGSSYCLGHHMICTGPGTASERAAGRV